jgi:uncharacterized OB-fold protein
MRRKEDPYTGERLCNKCDSWFFPTEGNYWTCKQCREKTEMEVEEELMKNAG